MINLYEDSKSNNYRRLECDGLLFVEYTCIPSVEETYSLWSPESHLVYVTSGKKTWITPDGAFPASAGDAVYCKKGACIMKNDYESEFCALIFFFPATFIKEVLLEYQLGDQKFSETKEDDFHVLRLNINDSLKIFFESVSSYLFQPANTSLHLLKLKFKELILQILTTDVNPPLKDYFLFSLNEHLVEIEPIIRRNLFYNLSISDYAQLCNRSLSSFKREFRLKFNLSPLQWINEERLKYAKARLLSTDENINEIAFHSGFESTAHFIRCFKKYFGAPPQKYRTSSKGSQKEGSVK